MIMKSNIKSEKYKGHTIRFCKAPFGYLIEISDSNGNPVKDADLTTQNKSDTLKVAKSIIDDLEFKKSDQITSKYDLHRKERF